MMDDSMADTLHATEQDENYFVSMTDMMVGILFVFIILLMVFALNYRTQTDVSDDRLKRLEQVEQQARSVADHLEQLQKQVRAEIQDIDASARVRSEMLEEIKKRLETLGLLVQIDETNGVLRLTEDAIRFNLNDDQLNARAEANVAKVALVLSDVLPSYSAGGDAPAHVETVFIEGHTDSTGIDARNWELSTARAVNTYRGLTQDAPTLRQLRNDEHREVLSVSGYSSTRPVPNAADDAVQRRIDLRFVMEVNERERLNALEGLTNDMQQQLVVLQNAVEQARGQ